MLFLDGFKRRHDQSIQFLIRLVFRQKLGKELGHVRERARSLDISRASLEVRSQDVTRRNANKLAAFLLKIAKSHFGEWLKRGAESTPDFSRAVGDASHLALVSCQKDADLVRLFKSVCSEHECLGLMKWHP